MELVQRDTVHDPEFYVEVNGYVTISSARPRDSEWGRHAKCDEMSKCVKDPPGTQGSSPLAGRRTRRTRKIHGKSLVENELFTN